MELRMKMVRVEYILELLEDLALKMEILEVFVFVLTCLSTNKQHTKKPIHYKPRLYTTATQIFEAANLLNLYYKSINQPRSPIT